MFDSALSCGCVKDLIVSVSMVLYSIGVEPLFEQIQNEEVPYPEGLVLSPPLRDLLEDIFIKDPQARIKLEHLESHEWVQDAKREEEEAHQKLQEEAAATSS